MSIIQELTGVAGIHTAVLGIELFPMCLNLEKTLNIKKACPACANQALSSPGVTDLRILFSIKWPIKALNRGPEGYRFEIDWKKLLQIYPFLNHANLCKPANSVNQKPVKKKKPSPAEQAKLYRKLLDSGKVKNKAAIARKFGVSRAWVSKVLS